MPFFQFAGKQFRNVGPKGLVDRTEKTGAGRVSHFSPALEQIDEGGGFVIGTRQHFCDDASEGGASPDCLEIPHPETALALKGIVPGRGTDEGAEKDEVPRDARSLRHQFAEVKSRYRSPDRERKGLPLAGRGIGFGIDQVHLGRDRHPCEC